MQRLARHVVTRQLAAAAVTLHPAPAAASLSAIRALATHTDAQADARGTGHVRAWAAAVAGVLSSAGLYAYAQQSSTALCEEQQASSGQTVKAKSARKYTAEEVAKHDSPDQRVWVTHKGGVYDITEFIEQHPGGATRIMLAAGGSVDSFWAMYQQHQTEQVQQLLEGYRIGDLDGAQPEQQVADPYSNEPRRHKALVVRSDKPFNAEVPLDILGAQITPNEFFYVRNHLPVPHVDASKWSLRVEGEGLRRVNLSLADLHTKFKKHTLTATLQCSGNRRAELSAIKSVKGLFWDNGAIGTAVFGGVLLRDVLQHAGLDVEETAAEHIQFEGLDSEPGGSCYGASIPLDKAVHRSGDVLLAYEMNGRALPLDHGFPLRVVVPGVTGARSVKWLSRIVASRDESGSHWQQKDYKSFSPMVDWDNVDWSSAPAIQETPVQSAILSPKPDEVLEGPLDEVDVSGWAFSGGGHGIIRVDVSADQGKTWISADLKPATGRHMQLHRQWAWTHWEATVPLQPGFTGKLDLCCRAVDASYNTQPESKEAVWNLRGVINNAWHHVQVEAT